MLEIILSAVAIVLSVMCSVYVIVKRPAKGEKGDPGERGPCGPMGMAGEDGKCWVYRINHDMFEVGYYLHTIDITIDDYSNDVFYVAKRYSREQDAAKRVNYLNGGCNGT